MALNATKMGIVLVLVTLFCDGAVAQLSCTRVMISLSPCLNYVTGNSSNTPPSSSCCSQLANIVQSQPQCLCSVLNGGGSSLGVTINQTQALSLPSACNVQTPPARHCNGANGPTNSPAADTSSGETPESKPSFQSATESKAVPIGRADGASKGRAMKVALLLHFSFFTLFIASCVF
ncbi:non-specific lipid transfer protein GPI-anchored 5-like isoform X1 [Ziziphus jujuba]|uniref:Non-specific lipid transfer protein GPI-anchored 5-like isoform X1 n=1 Tax=Ziziphus jujuba TaxID=326968 RepID=A0A6P4AR29_ZIZJJ|nr:non-specific lipid transfer protein GPI-anchored 5-like isoform X1 [Ziziphus jujuba]